MLLLIAAPAMADKPPCAADAKIAPEINNVLELDINGDPTVVTLNGEPSKPEPTEPGVTYSWQQTSGPPVELFVSDVEKPTFTVPSVGPLGATLTFQLTVTATACDPSSSTFTTTINVTNVVTNRPPVASATVSPNPVNEGQLVTLDGNLSSDPDGDTLTYTWEQRSGTSVTLDIDSSGAIATFIAPNDAYPDGESLTFRLTVSDGHLINYTDKIVNVIWVNDPPVAVISCPVEVDEGEDVTLDGSASHDPDDGIATYAWIQLQGLPNANLTGVDLTADSITFTAPQLGPTYNTMKFRLTVTDNGGLADSAECDIVVLDVTPPVITVPDDIIIEATSASGAVVTFDPKATDAVDGDVTVTCNPTSGSTFALGVTDVTCSANDNSGNPASASFNVTVQDTTPPTLSLPADITAEATGPSGAVVNYTASATDLVDGSVAVTCLPASGNTFAITTTKVDCSATDAHGNKATGSFNVIVRDTTPPVVTVPDNKTVEATGPSGAVVTYSGASATDLVDGSITPICSPASGSTFPLGINTVTCTATDAHGNSASKSFSITVQDTTPPVLTLPSDITVITVGMSGATVTYSVSATDLVDGSITPICTPASGSTFPLGVTTVNCTATDAHGNVANGSFKVTVTFTFLGFFQPVDNIPTLNTVKNGSTVPVKWKLQGQGGIEITDVKAVTATNAVKIACVSGSEDTIEEVAMTGATILRYDFTAMQFIFNWQTPKQPSTCWRLDVKLQDGTTHSANFKLK
jgi:hypothetical protein